MWRKIIGSGFALIVGGYYMIANQFVEDTLVGEFTYQDTQYVLYMTDHPDGTAFVSLWNYDEGSVHATTDWFGHNKNLSIDCQSANDCKVFRKFNEKDGTVSGWELKVSALSKPLTDSQYESENVHGFKPFTVQYNTDEVALDNVIAAPNAEQVAQQVKVTPLKEEAVKVFEEKTQLRSGART